ncbi:hypothetical protein QR680_003731 [Steinernema hermaphroditum]|uniref:Uncharacterized protein n=1 Tax=Steinernema hermaphroditum TaxID=289476 RepID=A0AA39HNM7_9BILA|nr:hypothetical protein QR680_003731 [Steinernema hermaphroditum]
MVTQVIHPSVPFGLAFVSLSCFGFFTNTLLFMTLINNKDFSPTTSRIIKSLCISCMLQLFGLAIGGIMTLAQSSFNDTFDVVVSALVQSAWLLYVGTVTTLALDRVLTFVWIKYTKYRLFPLTLLAASWLFGLSCFVLYCLPGFHWSYNGGNRGFFIFSYGRGSNTRVLSSEKYYDMTCFSAVLLMYLFLFIYIARMRIKSTHRLSSMTKELRILIAAVVSFAVQTVYVGGGYWQLFGGNSHPYVSLTMIIECGMFASVTMIISGTLREKAIEMILGKKAKVVVVTTHSSSSVQSSHK